MKITPPAGGTFSPTASASSKIWLETGDTLFASAYEVYDLLSEPYQKFLESLTATFMPPGHEPVNIADRMWKGPRGSPENVGADLRASHRCVRTNPLTGWKYVYAMGHHMEGIDGLADVESKIVTDHLVRLVTENHQLQVGWILYQGFFDVQSWLSRCSFVSSGIPRISSSGTTEPFTTWVFPLPEPCELIFRHPSI